MTPDAGYGCVASAAGSWKRFRPESGILVYGEQRGAALCDFNGDGPVDTGRQPERSGDQALPECAGQTRPARAAERITGQSRRIGSSLRFGFGNRLGAAREIHGGSGYWSQDSVVQVMGCPEAPTQIQVRWPGGKTTTSAIPAGAREITVDTDGKLTVNR